MFYNSFLENLLKCIELSKEVIEKNIKYFNVIIKNFNEYLQYK